MISWLLAGVLAAAPSCIEVVPSTSVSATDSLERLFRNGRTWQQFSDAARSRRETWKDNYDRGAPPVELVERARATGSWRILVVAEDWCGDSANTIPYLVRLVENLPSIEVRITNSRDGRGVMVAHPNAQGNPATPTILVLNERFEERACFVDSPARLQVWVKEHVSDSGKDRHALRMDWYHEDGGKETTLEMVELLEAAQAGRPTCRTESGSDSIRNRSR